MSVGIDDRERVKSLTHLGAASRSRSPSDGLCPTSLTMWRVLRWCDLRQIMNADVLLKASDPIDHGLEAILAKFFTFIFLETFRRGVKLVTSHDASQFRKQLCVLPCFVRSIHFDET